MGFVKSYIQLFAYGSVTSEDWKTYLFSYFKDKVRDTWLDAPAAQQLPHCPLPLRWTSSTRWTGTCGCSRRACLQSSLSECASTQLLHTPPPFPSCFPDPSRYDTSMADACLALARRWLTVRWRSQQTFGLLLTAGAPS